MIPALPVSPEISPVYRDFLSALAAAGFRGEVTERWADRTVLATDNSVYQLSPQAIIFPKNTADLSITMRLGSEPRFAGVEFAPRGGGTGTNGQSLTTGIMVDLSRHMNAIVEINVEERWARVQAGAVKDDLNKRLARHGLFFTPELSTSNRATIGGMINTDASGQGSVIYGKTRNHVLELTSVLADGTVWRSCPLTDQELSPVRSRDDLVGAVHRTVDDIQKTYAAEIEARFPKLNRCLTGYDLAHIRDEHGRFNLNSILCGSEGTLALIAEAKLNLMPIPKTSALIIISYDDFDATLRDAHSILARRPASVEAIDARVLGLAQQDAIWPTVKELLPLQSGARPTLGINIVEFIGDDETQVESQIQSLAGDLNASAHRGRQTYSIVRGNQVAQIWTMRKRAAGMLSNMPGEKRPITFVEDTAVPPENLADYILEFRAVLDSYGLQYGMFGHVDAGVLHVRPAIDMKDPEDAKLLRKVSDKIADLTLKYGGVLWGEHGKGMRSEYAPSYFGPLYTQVRAVKGVFDSRNQLNPGKVASPDKQALLKVDGVLTRGELERHIPPSVREDFAKAVFCNGNGACYNFDPDDPMCPSWKGTRERRHSPKGRATLTREWLKRLSVAGSNPIAEVQRLRSIPAWRSWPARVRNSVRAAYGERDFSHEVKEAMDGCLACKSCVTGCPIKVDVPSFRSKFLELYYGRYLRPVKDYLVGSLEQMLPKVAAAPGLYNTLVGSSIGKAFFAKLGLMDLPALSKIKFAAEIDRRGVRWAGAKALTALDARDKATSVVVVLDAFTRYYEPEVVLDVLDLIKAIGFQPYLAPFSPNGKALHVHGFLADFERVAQYHAAQLRSLAASGVPLVGIDPAMTLTYRAEYREALKADETPEVLLLQEWLARQPLKRCAKAGGTYRLIPHCTERAIAGASLVAWRQIFDQLGLRLEIASAGCCGMAGTYGHEAQHRETSARIYDLSWRAQIAASSQTTLATGYSCRSQVKRLQGSRLRHPAQAMLHAIQGRVQKSD
jgi:FAD/FMN-containing dehydrogenase/Fe-S oxidoreductase